MGFALSTLLRFPALGAVCMFSVLAPQGQVICFCFFLQFPAESLNSHGKQTFYHKMCEGNFKFNHWGYLLLIWLTIALQ